MRLIDADAPECWACTHHATGKCDTWCDHGEAFELREDVKNAPTVCVKEAIKQMKHCRDCKHLDMEQKSIIGCVCTNTDRKRPTTKNLGHMKYPSTPACKTGFEPREDAEPKNNIHDKAFTCPKCHNKTLVPVEELGVIGIGYHDLCICDECAAELLAEPQFDFTVKFVEPEDE